MKTRFLSLVLILPFIFLSNSLNAQDKEQELFNTAFPKFGNELKCSKDITKMDNKTVKAFRTELNRLSDANDDLIAYNAGALGEENSKIFTPKDLKKLDIKKLENIISDMRNKIIAYMGSLTKYGADSIRCIRTISLYEGSYKRKNYEAAYNHWSFLFKFYPKSRKSIYSNGTKVILWKFKTEKNKELKEKWIDTLMQVYDQRIKYYLSRSYPKGYVLGQKGKDLFKYSPNDLEKAYKILEESIFLQKVNSQDAILFTYMQATDAMFKKEKIDAAKFVDNYNIISDLLKQRLTKTKKPGNVKKTIENVDLIFSNSDAASCDNIVGAYKTKFEESPEDVELLNKIVKILSDKECTKSDLYFKVVVALDKAEPTAFSSYGIAKMYFGKENFEKSKEYYDKAIGMETNDSLKAKYYYESAIVLSKMGKKVASKSNALKAASLRENYGAPYLLIATLYVSSGCRQMTFTKNGNRVKGELSRISNWVAVDKLIKAKTIDPSITEDANKLIRSYSGFPNKEDAFSYGLTKGMKVTVGCWINETTTARF